MSTKVQHDEAMGGDARTRYPTTLKQLQVMAEKGLVQRDESQRSHLYAAIADEEQTEQSLLSSFIDRVFEGSVQKLMMHALDSGKVTDEEITQIKRALRQWEKRK